MVQTVQNTVDIYGHDHRDFTVAVHLKGGRCPCCVGRAGSTVACVVETAEITQLQVVENSSLYGGGSGDVCFFARFTGLFRSPSIWTLSAGWRGRRELAPRCSATQLRCILGATLDRHGAF